MSESTNPASESTAVVEAHSHDKNSHDKSSISDAYFRHVLLKGHAPVSVFAFCDELGLGEAEFYKHFASFEAIEQDYWTSTVEETLAVLHNDSDYQDYLVEQKLLAFYFTYFSHIQNHRSRVVECFPQKPHHRMSKLKGMRHAYLDYATDLINEGLAEETIAKRSKIDEHYNKLFFEHFLVLIHFYCNDSSAEFADTDAFIEKTVRVLMDALKSGIIDSGVDVLRFILPKLTGMR